jgi:hypothetical protein
MTRYTRALLTLLTGLVLVLLTRAPLVAQDPTTQPRVAETDLQYLGAFRGPLDAANGDNLAFGGGPLAFNPAGPSLFVTSRAHRVAEISIPTPVNSANIGDLPIATYLQGFFDPTVGHLNEIGTDGQGLGGLLVQGGKLLGTGWVYYDAGNGQRFSHYARSLRLNEASWSGWSAVWDAAKTGYVSGYMATIPTEWQTLLGGPTLTGQCCIPIVSRTSFGPDAFAFNGALVGQALVPAFPLLYYTGAHPTLGLWDGTVINTTYNQSTGMGGAAVIAGTRTALFIGRNGLGTPCYGEGTGNLALVGTPDEVGHPLCYDPVNNYKGTHAYPYRYQVWAYDLNDFAAVKAGTKQPWEIVPYGVWPLTFPIDQKDVSIGGVGYDPVTQRLYIAQMLADPNEYRPLIQVFHIGNGGVVTPPVTPPATDSQALIIAQLTARIAVLEAQVNAITTLQRDRDAALARITTIKVLIAQAQKQTTAQAALRTLAEALLK